jgi:hypothetical protein
MRGNSCPRAKVRVSLQRLDWKLDTSVPGRSQLLSSRIAPGQGHVGVEANHRHLVIVAWTISSRRSGRRDVMATQTSVCGSGN